MRERVEEEKGEGEPRRGMGRERRGNGRRSDDEKDQRRGDEKTKGKMTRRRKEIQEG